jgi:hypothetical protein
LDEQVKPGHLREQGSKKYPVAKEPAKSADAVGDEATRQL